MIYILLASILVMVALLCATHFVGEKEEIKKELKTESKDDKHTNTKDQDSKPTKEELIENVKSIRSICEPMYSEYQRAKYQIIIENNEKIFYAELKKLSNTPIVSLEEDKDLFFNKIISSLYTYIYFIYMDEVKCYGRYTPSTYSKDRLSYGDMMCLNDTRIQYIHLRTAEEIALLYQRLVDLEKKLENLKNTPFSFSEQNIMDSVKNLISFNNYIERICNKEIPPAEVEFKACRCLEAINTTGLDAQQALEFIFMAFDIKTYPHNTEL